MRNLLNFLARYSSWFVFTFYAVLSCCLLFQSNPYQHHVFLTSAGAISTGVYEVTNNVTGYFSLRSINEDLQRQTALLQGEVLQLKDQLRQFREDSLQRQVNAADTARIKYNFIIGSVINNSIHNPYNYITINKGLADGVRPEMGVLDQNGVVGVVNVVTPHYARIISLLNPNFRLSCKLRGSDTFGSLVWDGTNPRTALLEELPKHTQFKRGDTIVTSGYSAMFPEGIPVGIIEGSGRGDDDNFFTDFTALSTVKVISNTDIVEIKAVEAKDETESIDQP